MQTFQVSAQQNFQKKESELFQPIVEKLQKAIKDVGAEGKFIYIYEEATLLYRSDKSVDVTDLVKAKLGM